jgi:RecA/RadA recombinase
VGQLTLYFSTGQKNNMAKAFDISKFRKSITKSIDGLSIGFNDPTDWVSTNNYALNYLISGYFDRGIPLGKVTVFAGESGAGKSFICSGNLVANAQSWHLSYLNRYRKCSRRKMATRSWR